ncbi:MAG: zf-HC2 domain-containing protein [Vicinamibacterales bacterium]
MSNCQEFESLITALVDDELSDADRQRVQQHLERCSPCRAVADAERHVQALIHAERATLCPAAPVRLGAACARAADGGRARGAADWKRWAIAASLLTAAVVGFGLWSGGRTPALASELLADHERCFRFEPTTLADVRSIEVDGQAISVPAGDPSHGLELHAVRRCRLGVMAAAHALYRSHGGQVSLFVAATPASADFGPEIMGYEVRTWRRADRQYALVGHLASSEMDDVLAFMREHDPPR